MGICLLGVLGPVFAQNSALRLQALEPVGQSLSRNPMFGMQDREGFLWICGAQGMDRYDGYHLRRFRYDPKDSTTIASNTVMAMAETESGAIWVATEAGGICRFEKQTEEFQRFNLGNSEAAGWPDDETHSIMVYRDSLLWVGTTQGLATLDLKAYRENGMVTFRPVHYDLVYESKQKRQHIRGLAADEAGNVWVGFGNGATQIPAKDIRSGHMYTARYAAVVRGLGVRSIRQAPDKSIWMGTHKGLLRFSADAKLESDTLSHRKFFPVPENIVGPSGNFINAILFDSKGALWVGLRGYGIAILSPEGVRRARNGKPKFEHYQQDRFATLGVESNQINYLFEDRSQNIWACTYGPMYKINTSQRQFHHTQTKRGEGWSNTIFGLFQDVAGTIWTGSKSGLAAFSPGSQEYRLRQVNTEIKVSGDNVIRSILSFGRDSLFVTTLGGLWIYDKAKDRFSRFEGLKGAPEILLRNRLFGAIRDQSGHFWIGGTAGLLEIDPKAKTLRQYQHDPEDPSSIGRNFVRIMREDRNGNLWVGTDKGLDVLTAKERAAGTARFSRFQHSPTDTSSLSSNEIRAIYEDSKGRLWIGTDGGGINQFDPKTGLSIRFDMRHGLCNNVIYGILEANDGSIWISTNDGLSRFDPETRTFINFDYEDGLQGNEWNVRCAFKSPSGELLFGGVNG
ncbi:MAG: two-component regulator propeller domain-containing protein, partial [Bacteroidota bacterium]